MTITADIRRLPLKLEGFLLPLAIAVIVFAAILFYSNSNYMSRSRAAIERLNQVAQKNETFLSSLKDLETGQRGYLITGNPSYLVPYRSARAALPGLMEALAGVVRAPQQMERVGKLRPLLADKIAEVDSTISVRDRFGAEPALAIVRAGRGEASMNAIRQLSAEIGDDAHSRLLIESRDLEHWRVQSRDAILAVCAVLAAFLGLSLRLIHNANKRREELIRQLEGARTELHVTLNSIGDGVITTDTHGIVTFLNPVAEALTGWKLADATGQAMEAVFPISHEDTGQVVENPVRRAIRERSAVAMANQACLTRRDGSQLGIDDSAAPIFDHQKNLAGVVMIFRDVTGRRTIVESLKRWEHIFHHAGFGMAILTPGERPMLEQVNPAFAAMHGYEPAELAGKPYSTVVAPELWTAKVRALQGETADHVMTETVHVRKDGTQFPALSDITLVRNESGKILYCTGYYSDISDRKRAEQELRASEERYRTTADSLPQLVWTSTADGTTEYLNNRWQEDTGLTLEAAGVQGWAYFLDPEDRDKCLAVWKQALGSGETFQTECRFRRAANEKPRWYNCRAVPIRGADGKIVRWFGSCTDVDEQRQATDLLREANEALKRSNLDLEQFAYAASHDLQEPLRMVVIYSQLLKEEYGNKLTGQGSAYLDFAVDGALRMESLLKDLLSYARAGAPDEHFNETGESAEAFKSACVNLAALLQQSNAEVSVGLLPQVKMPEVYLTQVFQNLLSNSIKYRQPNKRLQIEVGAERRDGMWQFLVKDNGIGVAPEHQEQIFRVFRRLHGQDVPGTGIGLALCHKLIERSGGKIWIQSDLGRGSAFYFTARPCGENTHA